jgi:FkbM family methyltransferase
MAVRFFYRRAVGSLERELSYAARLVRPGTLAVDVGANKGLYSYAFWRAGGTVEAFEPHPPSAAALRADARFARDAIRVHETALSDAVGDATLTVPVSWNQKVSLTGWSTLGVPSCPHAKTEVFRVQRARLDDFDLRDVSVIKIDVEGHELEVVRGAEQTIRREQPALLIEVEVRHHKVPMSDILSEITRVAGPGYGGHFLDSTKRWRPLTEFDSGVHQVAQNDPYINNFLFLPPGVALP